MDKRPRGPEEEKVMAEFVDCYLLGRAPEGMELLGLRRETWRCNLLVQFLKKKDKTGLKQIPKLLKTPQFPGPCTFPCHQSTSQETWSLHYHWILEECSQEEAVTMKANQVFSVETPNGTLLVRDEEMKEVLKLLKTFYLLDFGPLWSERKTRRLKRLLHACLITNWRIEEALEEADEYKQLEHVRKNRCCDIPFPYRDVFEMEPRDSLMEKYGRIYYHELGEKSMFDKRNLKDDDQRDIKTWAAIVNHRFFHCRGCIFDQSNTEKRHYHYVADAVYQSSKEFQSLRPNFPGFIPESLRVAHESRLNPVETYHQSLRILYLFTEKETEIFKKMFQVRFGKPVSERNMQNFFQSDSRVKWKNSPEELTDQFENDDSIPGYTPPIEVVLPNELGDTLTAAPVCQSNGEASTSHENGVAEAPVDQRNGERHSQQAPSELNGFPQIEEARQANGHLPKETNGLLQRGKRKLPDEPPTSKDSVHPLLNNKKAVPDQSPQSILVELKHLLPSTSRVCNPGHDRSQLNHSSSTSSDTSKI